MCYDAAMHGKCEACVGLTKALHKAEITSYTVPQAGCWDHR